MSQLVGHPMTYATGLFTPGMLLAVTVAPQTSTVVGTAATRTLTGVALAAFWAASVWGGVGVLRRERWFGTLARSVTGVADARWVLVGKVLGAGVLNLSVVLGGLGIASLALGLRPTAEHGWAIVVGLVATLMSGVAASTAVGSLLLTTRHGVALSSAMGAPITLLGGTVLPVAYLPELLRPLSWVVSLSWLQRFLVSAAQGPLDWVALVIATALTVAYSIAGWRLFGALVVRARREATLELT